MLLISVVDLSELIIVWISSINRIIPWFESFISLRNKLSLSSNWPRNFVPETNAPKSIEIIFKFFNESGTLFSTINWASNLAIEVLPTPG